jgi:sialate O-acetylesterase
MVIDKGVKDYQVLQREENGRASAEVSGVCDGAIEGDISVEVLEESAPGTSVMSQKAGEARKGKWSARLDAIPVGGPYAIEFSICLEDEVRASVTARHILVGDIWVLAGQSNMVSCGETCIETPSPFVHVFELSDRWSIAEEPLFWPLEAVDPVYYLPQWDAAGQLPVPSNEERMRQAREARETRKDGGGLGLTFAKEIQSATGAPIGLIPAARGGTQIAEWSPSLKELGGKSLYYALIRRVREAGPKVKGLLWYQGESDSWNGRGTRYEKALQEFFASVRSDIGQEDLPILCVQLCRAVQMANLFEWNLVQDIQRRIGEIVPNTGVVASVDLSLRDVIHLSAKAQMRLGRRLANLARRMVYKDDSVDTGPRLKSVRMHDGSRTRIAVEYEGVNGGLLPKDNIAGFSIWERNVRCETLVEAAVDEKRGGVVTLLLSEPLAEGGTVMYGYGPNPYCNLRDECDMAAPAFDPVVPEPGRPL